MPSRAEIKRLERELVTQGKIIEAGWVALRLMAIPPDAPDCQIDEMRNAFFAGAQYLYFTLISTVDPGDEPTKADLERMDKIEAELNAFIQDYQLRHFPAEGGVQ